jgi:hypothetical protein
MAQTTDAKAIKQKGKNMICFHRNQETKEVKKLKELINSNYSEEKFKISISYENCFSNAATSLLIEKR